MFNLLVHWDRQTSVANHESQITAWRDITCALTSWKKAQRITYSQTVAKPTNSEHISNSREWSLRLGTPYTRHKYLPSTGTLAETSPACVCIDVEVTIKASHLGLPRPWIDLARRDASPIGSVLSVCQPNHRTRHLLEKPQARTIYEHQPFLGRRAVSRYHYFPWDSWLRLPGIARITPASHIRWGM